MIRSCPSISAACILTLLVVATATAQPADRPVTDLPPSLALASLRTLRPVNMNRGLLPEDPNLMLHARLRSPMLTMDRITSWVTQLNPETSSAAFRQRWTAFGFDPAQFRPGANVALYLWKPASPGANAAWAVQLPFVTNAPMIAMLSLFAPAKTMLGPDMIVAGNPDTLAAVRNAAEMLANLNAAPLPTDLQIVVNVETFHDAYGTNLRSMYQFMENAVAELAAADPGQMPIGQMRATQRMIRAQGAAVMTLADQLRAVCLTLNLNPGAAEVSLALDPRPDTPMAGALNKPPADSPDIARFLGNGHTIDLQLDVANNKDLIREYLRYVYSTYPSSTADRTGQLLRTLDELLDLDVRSYAVAIDLAPDAPLLGGAIALVEIPQSLTGFARQNTDLLAMQAFGFRSGLEFHAELQPNVRAVRGQSVDHCEIGINVPPYLPPGQAQWIKTIWRDQAAALDLMPFGNAALVSLGMPIEDLVEMVSTDPGVSMLNARRIFSPGALLYLDLDLAGYMKVTTAPMGWRQPTTDVQVVPLSLAIWCQNGAACGRLRLPIQTFAAMRGLRPPPEMRPNRGRRGGRGGAPGQAPRGGRGGRSGMLAPPGPTVAQPPATPAPELNTPAQ